MISAENFRSEYNGNGSTTVFAYGFPVSNKTYITVTQTVIATEVESTLTVDTDYTVNPAGLTSSSSSDWHITMASAPASTVRITITPNLPLEQLTDFENQGGFFADTHEDAFDYLTIVAQQQQEELDRAVKVSVGSTTDPDDLISDLEDAADAAADAADRAEAAAALAGSATAEGVLGYRSSSIASTARNASCGISTRPTCFIRFFPSFCFSRSFRFREISPP